MTSIWKRTNAALVAVNYTSLDDLKKYREAIRDAGLNVNNCELIAVVSNKKEKEALNHSSLAIFIAPQDINFLGRLKNADAQKALGRKYELLLVVGELSKKLSKAIGRVQADFTAGINCTNMSLSVNLETEGNSPQHLINFAKETLEKII